MQLAAKGRSRRRRVFRAAPDTRLETPGGEQV